MKSKDKNNYLHEYLVMCSFEELTENQIHINLMFVCVHL